MTLLIFYCRIGQTRRAVGSGQWAVNYVVVGGSGEVELRKTSTSLVRGGARGGTHRSQTRMCIIACELEKLWLFCVGQVEKKN